GRTVTDQADAPPLKSSPAPALPIAGGAMALVTGLISWGAAGPTLGLLIASLTFATLIAPPLAVAERYMRSKLLTVAAIVAGMAVAWLFAFVPSVGCPTSLAMLAVLATFVFAITG